MLQAIFFDLDGTLLPMDNDAFTKYYFKILAKTAYPWGYTDLQKFVDGIWDGVKAMIQNDGTVMNNVRFWDRMRENFGPQSLGDKPKFDEFYKTKFNEAIAASDPKPELAKKAVSLAHQKAGKVILATNPIFTREADITRIGWLGLTEEDFDLITDYENSCHSKPNPQYYQDIMDQFHLDPAQCLMLGNDVGEDMVSAEQLGMSVFLVTDYLINRENVEINCPCGSYEDMVAYLEKL